MALEILVVVVCVFGATIVWILENIQNAVRSILKELKEK